MQKKYPQPKIIVILGPTASGKSELAVKIAKKHNGEIISADSRQIYKNFNIGTDKIPGKWKKKKFIYKDISHYCVDFVSPKKYFTLADYKKCAIKAIKNAHKKGKLPILVGGAGLYIKTIVDNLEIPEVKPDPKLREKIETQIKKRGLENLYKKLIRLDPESADFIDPKNPRRIIRGLEVISKTGRPFSLQRKRGEPLFETLQIGIKLPSKILKQKIEKRVENQIKRGLIKEIKNLVKKYGEKIESLNSIGYKEIIKYFDKKITLDEAIKLIKRNNWLYAKRQMTWFKKDKRIRWIKSQKQAEKLIFF